MLQIGERFTFTAVYLNFADVVRDHLNREGAKTTEGPMCYPTASTNSKQD